MLLTHGKVLIFLTKVLLGRFPAEGKKPSPTSVCIETKEMPSALPVAFNMTVRKVQRTWEEPF